MWTGSMGYTADMQPIVGRLDQGLNGRSTKGSAASSDNSSKPTPAEWVSARYNDEGIVYSLLCGLSIAPVVLV
jgi:hypothetical protein